MPDKTIAGIELWNANRTTILPPLDESPSANAGLRIAAPIAAALPIKLFDDTSSLDNSNRNRGLVLTALGHLLTRGGAAAFASATTWSR